MWSVGNIETIWICTKPDKGLLPMRCSWMFQPCQRNWSLSWVSDFCFRICHCIPPYILLKTLVTTWIAIKCLGLLYISSIWASQIKEKACTSNCLSLQIRQLDSTFWRSLTNCSRYSEKLFGLLRPQKIPTLNRDCVITFKTSKNGPKLNFRTVE